MKNVGKILAALLALVVLLSFSSVIAFAEEADDSAASTDAVTDESKDETSSDETSGDETSAETKADEESKKDTTTSTTEKEDEEDHFVLYTGLITLAIIVVIAICVVVWILKDKERALKTWRSFKSEFKKIVWAEKHETLKKTIIVVVALVVFGAVIGLLDYLFSLAVVSLGKLI